MATKSGKRSDDNALEDLADVNDSDEIQDQDEPGKLIKTKAVSGFIRMWPRAIFDTPIEEGARKTIATTVEELAKPGVYVLYRDDFPFYVGKTTGKLRFRLRQHAVNVGSVRNYFWNYFSAYVVENESDQDEVEAILISAMPSVVSNSSAPKFENRVPMNPHVRRLMHKLHRNGDY